MKKKKKMKAPEKKRVSVANLWARLMGCMSLLGPAR